MKEKEITKLIKEVEDKLDAIPMRKRLKQTEVWLRKNFPTPYPVTVRIIKFQDDACGECYRLNKNIVIRINKETPRHEQISSLIHEWAHAMTWPNSRLEKINALEHPDEWGLDYAKIYRGWFDFGGFLESSGIKVDKLIADRMNSQWHL